MNFRNAFACTALLLFSVAATAQEVIVMSGFDETIGFLEQEDWWGEENRDEQLTVPRLMITGITQRWRETSQNLPVQYKKEIFYRLMLPLIVHANDMVLDRREDVISMQRAMKAGEAVTAEQFENFKEGAALLRIAKREELEELQQDSDSVPAMIEEMLYKLDIIPAGLALGQAAYESGYGTSRFAVEGNALFGQWTYGGKGLVPEQQRKNLGDHRIAAFDWPFDSVRGYFINLMSHPAYEDFRKLRAELRAEGKPLESMTLADGLIRYSERGQEYVDTLKGIMRVNGLTIADDAVFRDEPVRFVVGAESPEDAEELRKEVERLRSSGELEQIIARMRLE